MWTNRPIWPQGGRAARAGGAPPANLHWDLWLGPAPGAALRPSGYHPFSWRGWWDFGTGALGDMACHTVNMPFMALDLRDPVSVQAETSGHNKDSYPAWSHHLQFPATVRPAAEDGLVRRRQAAADGAVRGTAMHRPRSSRRQKTAQRPLRLVIVGDKGKLFSPGDYGGAGCSAAPSPKVQIPKSPGHFE